MPSAALPVIGGLAVAYLDRVANGDSARASVVLNEVVSVWPDFRSDFSRDIATLAQHAATVSYPATLTAVWGGAMRDMLSLSLMYSSPQGQVPAFDSATDQLAEATTSTLAARARAVLAAIPADAPIRRYVARSASTAASSLGRVLDALVAGTVATGGVEVPRPATPYVEAIPRPRSTPIALPEIPIVGHVGTPTSSPWGWYALAGVVAIGLGVFAWTKLRGPTQRQAHA